MYITVYILKTWIHDIMLGGFISPVGAILVPYTVLEIFVHHLS